MTDWKPIEELENPDFGDHILWNGRRFVGWLNDDGWHDVNNADHMDEPEQPQPTLFHPWPEPPQE